MFFTHVVILLKICYVISDKQKYISLVVVAVTNDLWLHLLRINIVQKEMSMCKKDDKSLYQNSIKLHISIVTKAVGLFLDP